MKYFEILWDEIVVIQCRKRSYATKINPNWSNKFPLLSLSSYFILFPPSTVREWLSRALRCVRFTVKATHAWLSVDDWNSDCDLDIINLVYVLLWFSCHQLHGREELKWKKFSALAQLSLWAGLVYIWNYCLLSMVNERLVSLWLLVNKSICWRNASTCHVWWIETSYSHSETLLDRFIDDALNSPERQHQVIKINLAQIPFYKKNTQLSLKRSKNKMSLCRVWEGHEHQININGCPF